MPADRVDGRGSAFGLADHADEAGFSQHHLRELVHAGRCGRACGPHHFVPHGVHGSHVVDKTVGEVHAVRQGLAAGQHVLNPLVRRIAPGEQLARDQESVARLPGGDFLPRDGVQVDPFRVRSCFPPDIRVVRQSRWCQLGRSGAVQFELDVSGGGAVRNHRHGQGSGVGGILVDLDVEYRGQATQSLGADTQRVDFLVEFQPQLVDGRCRSPAHQFLYIDGFHQRLFCQQHRLFSVTTDPDAEHAGRAPARTHAGQGVQHPVDDGGGGVEDREARLVLGAAPLGRHFHRDAVARHQAGVDHRGRVVPGIAASAEGRVDNGCTQDVVGVGVGTPNPLVHQFLQRPISVPANLHTHVHEDHHAAGILAYGPMTLGAHARVQQDLGHGVFGGRRFFTLVGVGQCLYVVPRVVIGDELQAVGDALDQVVLLDDGHGVGFPKTQAAAGAAVQFSISLRRVRPATATSSGPRDTA